MISPSQSRYLTQTQTKHQQTSMPLVGFEHTTPAFKRAKTGHDLDRAATGIGVLLLLVESAVIILHQRTSRGAEPVHASAITNLPNWMHMFQFQPEKDD
jgi:hypothetical protein